MYQQIRLVSLADFNFNLILVSQYYLRIVVYLMMRLRLLRYTASENEHMIRQNQYL
jgi:hypothetical protein